MTVPGMSSRPTSQKTVRSSRSMKPDNITRLCAECCSAAAIPQGEPSAFQVSEPRSVNPSAPGPIPRRPLLLKQWPFVFGTSVQSISITAWRTLTNDHPGLVRQLGRYSKAIDLMVGKDIVTLVTQVVGDGPYNVVVNELPSGDLPKSARVLWSRGKLALGPWILQFSPTSRLWDCRPAWERLHPHHEALNRLGDLVRRAALLSGSASPLAQAGADDAQAPVEGFRRALGSAAQMPNEPHLVSLSGATAEIAGWGPGLTPSGDDFLAGCLLALWAMQHPARQALAETIYSAAAPRTTLLSAALLRAAAMGHAPQSWHDLLDALDTPHSPRLEPATRAVLASGATSGFDALVGFTTAVGWLTHGRPFCIPGG